MRVAWIIAAAVAAASVITLWGVDIPVATTAGDQGLQLRVVSDGVRGAILVWHDRGQSRVLAQRIDADGQKLWGAAKYVTFTDWEQFEPSAVADGSGGVIVAWIEGRDGFCTAGFKGECDVYAQRFSATATRLWGSSGVPITRAPANQGVSGLSIASDGQGGAFITWEDARPDCCKVYAQHVASDGTTSWTADGIRLSPEPSIVFGPISAPPEVVSDGEDGAIVVWLDDQVDPLVEPPPVTAQRVDAAGNVVWQENGVRLGSPMVTSFGVAGDAAGGAFVAFVASTGTDFGEMSVQRVSAAGAPLWGENGVLVGATDYYAETPDLVADGADGVIVTWVDHGYDESSSTESIDVRAQRLDADGTPLWGTAGKPLCTSPGEQDDPRALSDGHGGGIFVWRDCRDYPNRIDCFSGSDIYAQHVTADGTELWPANGTPVSVAGGPQSVGQGLPARHFIHMATDMVGGAIVAWPDGRRFGCENAIFTTECDVYAQRINSTPPMPGCGDPTGDGEVTATDALLTLNAAVDLVSCELIYCDVDDSGAVFASDALLILSAAVGLPVELSCPTALYSD